MTNSIDLLTIKNASPRLLWEYLFEVMSRNMELLFMHAQLYVKKQCL